MDARSCLVPSLISSVDRHVDGSMLNDLGVSNVHARLVRRAIQTLIGGRELGVTFGSRGCIGRRMIRGNRYWDGLMRKGIYSFETPLLEISPCCLHIPFPQHLNHHEVLRFCRYPASRGPGRENRTVQR
jgi:hypothetical protein